MTEDFPTDWSLRSVDDCMEAIIDYRGKSPTKTSVGVPLITAKVVKGGRIDTPNEFIAVADYDSWMRRGLPKPGDVVITTEAPLGEVAQLDGRKVALAQRLIALRGKTGVLDNTYLKFVAQSTFVQDQLKARATGTTVLGIRQSELRKVIIPHPPHAEQRRIADILCSLDDKIELNRRTNETLEVMARTLFRSWFVDFDPVRATADGQTPPGLDAATAKLFPDSFEPSALGPIPKGWRVGTLAETLSELETGNRPKGGVSGITSGVPSIGAESIDGLGVFDFTKTKFVPQAFFDSMGRGHVRSRDVLLYKDGGRPGMFEPHVAMFGDDFPFSVCSINEHVYRIRANDQLSQAFLYFWLSEELALAEMRVKGTGVAVPGLNSTAVRSLKVLVPSKEIVAAFDRFAEPLITAVLRNAKEQVTITTTRDALLPKLLSGEVRV